MYIMGKRDRGMTNREVLRERRGDAGMLNGVGGMLVRWSTVVQPDESIKGNWTREEESETIEKCRN